MISFIKSISYLLITNIFILKMAVSLTDIYKYIKNKILLLNTFFDIGVVGSLSPRLKRIASSLHSS